MQSVLLAFLSTVDAGSFGTEILRSYDTDLSRGNRLVYDSIIRNDRKRGLKTAPVGLANLFYQYTAQLRIGSDQQLLTPSIDTGSSDLWVMAAENPYCGTPDFTCTNQIFNPQTSTTFTNLSLPWDISYLDTTGAFGFLSTDDVTFQGGATIKNANFALANTANSSTDVFGIGFVADEASRIYQGNDTWGGYTYPNLPVSIKDQGLISRVAYSLYLNDVNAGEGQLLFGGVDHAKYDGTLNLLPMVNIYRTIKEIIDFRVLLNGISVKTGDSTCGLAEFAAPVLLDSGTSYALLPSKIIASLAGAMGYSLADGDVFYSGDCATAFAFDTFELDFSGLKLQVPPESLLDYAYESDFVTEVYKNGKKQCILAIQPTENRANFILGDVFMRNFYIVYDLEGYQIAMAQANFNAAGSNVEDIVDSIPGAVPAPSYSSTAFNAVILTADPQRCFKASQSRSTAVFTKPDPDTPQSFAPGPIVSGSNKASRPAVATGSVGYSVSASGSKVSAAASGSNAAATATGSKSAESGATGSKAAGSGTAGSSAAGPSATGSQTVGASITGSLAASVSTGSIAAATGSGSNTSGSNAASSNAAVASAVSGSASLSSTGSTYTTSIAGPTTLTAGGETYTVTGATVLTITDCGCTKDKTKTATLPSVVTTAAPSYVTTVVTSFVTTCSGPTTFATNGETYTVTDSTVITVTNCPCTLVVPATSSTIASSSASSSVPSSVSVTSSSESEQSSSPTSATQASSTVEVSSSTPASSSTSASSSAPSSGSTQSAASSSTVPPIANGASSLVAPFGLVAGLVALLV